MIVVGEVGSERLVVAVLTYRRPEQIAALVPVLVEQAADDRALPDLRRRRRVEAKLRGLRHLLARARNAVRPIMSDAPFVLVGLSAEHIGAAPDLAADQPALARDRIGAGDRADGDADIEGQVALRGKLGARRKRAFRDAALDAVG